MDGDKGSLWLREILGSYCWPVWASIIVQTLDGDVSGSSRRRYPFSFEKWPCSVSMGRSVPTLPNDNLPLGGIVFQEADSRKWMPIVLASGQSEGFLHQRLFRTVTRMRCCPPLGVYSLWLPSLPHGCSCYLWMSKEGKFALVLTKAELCFSVER